MPLTPILLIAGASTTATGLAFFVFQLLYPGGSETENRYSTFALALAGLGALLIIGALATAL